MKITGPYGVTYDVRTGVIESLNAWMASARPVGGFLDAVLRNDLVGAIGRADDENLHTLPGIVQYMYDTLPGSCWGSADRVTQWITSHRDRPRNAGPQQGEDDA